MRLKPEEDMPYRWKIEDPCLEYLFQKHLSKHSVGAYMLLQREVGQKFFAIQSEKVNFHISFFDTFTKSILGSWKKGRSRSHCSFTSRKLIPYRESEIGREQKKSQWAGYYRSRRRDQISKLSNQGGANNDPFSSAGNFQVDRSLWLVSGSLPTLLYYFRTDNSVFARRFF